jgi:hypothetical protein
MDKTIFPSSLGLGSMRLLDKLEEKEYDTCAEGVVRFESSPRYQFHQVECSASIDRYNDAG